MRHWNAHQSGGQGRLVDFDKHFKVLSSEDKEVWSSSQNTPVNANHSIPGHITAFHERTVRRSIHRSTYLLSTQATDRASMRALGTDLTRYHICSLTTTSLSSRLVSLV